MITQRGISLLELIVVVAIIAITGSLAAPSMSTWSCKRSVKNDLASVTNMLEVQRQKALTGHLHTAQQLDKQTQRYPLINITLIGVGRHKKIVQYLRWIN